MNQSTSKKVIHTIDPLVDPAIVYFVLAGLVKPFAYSIINATQPDALVQPIVGEIWRGLDATVLSSSIAYLMSAGFLFLVRSNNRGIRISDSISKGSARWLSVLVSALATAAIVEAYILDSRYIAVTILPVYLGWISGIAGKMPLPVVLMISGLVYLATLSKWVIIGLPVALSVSASLVAGVILFAVYPLLNQLRFFLVGLFLGYSVYESVQFLNITSIDFTASIVSLLYRLQSFEGSYLVSTSGIENTTGTAISALDLSQVISFGTYQLDYGLAVSMFSQLDYAVSDPTFAGVAFFLVVIIYVVAARALVKRAPSLAFILGLYLPIISTDGFVLHRGLYFSVGVAAFFIFVSIAKYRFRFGGSRRRLSGEKSIDESALHRDLP